MKDERLKEYYETERFEEREGEWLLSYVGEGGRSEGEGRREKGGGRREEGGDEGGGRKLGEGREKGGGRRGREKGGRRERRGEKKEVKRRKNLASGFEPAPSIPHSLPRFIDVDKLLECSAEIKDDQISETEKLRNILKNGDVFRHHTESTEGQESTLPKFFPPAKVPFLLPSPPSLLPNHPSPPLPFS
jgi:hypothetical protein